MRHDDHRSTHGQVDATTSARDRGAGGSSIEEVVRRKADRKLRARREDSPSLWYGFGMFGLVGWSVAIPTLIGIAVGLWLDAVLSDSYSWTLMGLGLGIVVGCLNAWFWVKREGRI